MTKSKVLVISTLFVLVLATIYFLLNGRNQVGRYADAKVVQEIPLGFIHLPPNGGDWENGLHYVCWESQISFLDIDESCIYQTSFENNMFIVKYKNEYYVDEEKLLELVDIATSSFEQRK